MTERYVEELLRYDSPVQLTSRWSPTEVEFAGVPLRPYDRILILLGAGNRDPARFAKPDRFDPTRENNQPLSFGAGHTTASVRRWPGSRRGLRCRSCCGDSLSWDWPANRCVGTG